MLTANIGGMWMWYGSNSLQVALGSSPHQPYLVGTDRRGNELAFESRQARDLYQQFVLTRMMFHSSDVRQ